LGIAWVSKTQPSQGIDFAMGIQSGSGNLGVLLAYISAGFLAQKFSWRLPFLVWSALGIFLGTASVLAVRKVSSKSKESLKPDLSSWIQTLSKIRHSILGFIFGGACWSTTVYFAPSLLHHKFHIPMGQTGVFMASWIGLGTVISYFFGVLARRFGRSKICLTAFLCSALSLCLLGMASGKELAVVGLFLFGTFLFLVYPALQAFVGGQVPEKNQTLAFSLVANIQLIAGATMVLVSGFVSDRFGINSPFLILAALGLLVTLSYGSKLFKL
jgi:MFS family permease